MSVVLTPRNPLIPRPLWTHDSNFPPQLTPPSHLPRPQAEVPMDVFTAASAPTRMPLRAKRAREPDSGPAQAPLPKKVCAVPSPAKVKAGVRKAPVARIAELAKKKEMKEQAFHAQEKEFREKYTRAFPAFAFHFDSLDAASSAALTQRVQSLGARVENFFSKKVSHVITSRPIPNLDHSKAVKGDQTNNTSHPKRDIADKENAPPRSSQQAQNQKARKALAPSRPALANLSRRDGNLVFEDAPAQNDLLTKALHFGMKVWTVEKLVSVLDRIQMPMSPTPPAPSASLSHLLADERLHGTRERDPAALRPDYTYFPRNSCFVLIEDISGEHAPIVKHHYERPARGQPAPWPVLYANIGANGPFSPGPEEFPSLEESEPQTAPVPQRAITAPGGMPMAKRPTTDLRKVLSMNNLTKRGYAAAGNAHDTPGASAAPTYMAASGNSVNITSAVASTRSGAGVALPGTTANAQLAKRLHHQVLTNRLAAAAGGADKERVVRKSKSTNTVRLPKREETHKPGYCENCRQKFSNFDTHIRSDKHRAFAEHEPHFSQLDEVLDRLRRPMIWEALDIDAELARLAEAEAYGMGLSDDERAFGLSDAVDMDMEEEEPEEEEEYGDEYGLTEQEEQEMARRREESRQRWVALGELCGAPGLFAEEAEAGL